MAKSPTASAPSARRPRPTKKTTASPPPRWIEYGLIAVGVLQAIILAVQAVISFRQTEVSEILAKLTEAQSAPFFSADLSVSDNPPFPHLPTHIRVVPHNLKYINDIDTVTVVQLDEMFDRGRNPCYLILHRYFDDLGPDLRRSVAGDFFERLIADHDGRAHDAIQARHEVTLLDIDFTDLFGRAQHVTYEYADGAMQPMRDEIKKRLAGAPVLSLGPIPGGQLGTHFEYSDQAYKPYCEPLMSAIYSHTRPPGVPEHIEHAK